MLDRVFHLTENKTTVRRELLAGLTTFMTMAYVVVVNPRILSEAGMPVDGVLFATCISAALATLVMGLWANYPIALAPGMSLNAYFTYSIVIGRGVPWQTALGVVFLSGLLFLILTLTNVREQIVNGIPDCLKHGTAAGIGLFIAFVGFRNANIIVANASTFVGLGKISDPQVILAAVGILLIAILMARRVGSAILIGIVVLRSSISIAWESLHTLLEAAPPGVHVDDIADEIAGKFDNIRLHHLHVWEVGPGQRVLTAHMKVDGLNLVEVEAVATEVRSFLREKWGISHVTLEAEATGCGREHLLGEWR